MAAKFNLKYGKLNLAAILNKSGRPQVIGLLALFK